MRIEEPVDAGLGTKGQKIVEWRTFADKRAAECIEGESRELFNTQQVQPDVDVLVKLRWLAGVTAEMRIVWLFGNDERILNLAGPPTNPDGRKQRLVCKCIEEK